MGKRLKTDIEREGKKVEREGEEENECENDKGMCNFNGILCFTFTYTFTYTLFTIFTIKVLK